MVSRDLNLVANLNLNLNLVAGLNLNLVVTGSLAKPQELLVRPLNQLRSETINSIDVTYIIIIIIIIIIRGSPTTQPIQVRNYQFVVVTNSIVTIYDHIMIIIITIRG